MGWQGELEPRDRVAAGRVAAGGAVVVGAALVGIEAFGLASGRASASPGTLGVAIVVGAVLLGAALTVRRSAARVPRAVWAGLPVLALVTLVGLHLIAPEQGAAGQVGLIYPVVFAAAVMRRRFAGAVTVLAVLASAWIALTARPLADAAVDLAATATALTVTACVLVRTGRRQDELTARLATLAATDPLTGLATRRGLEDAALALGGARSARAGLDGLVGNGLVLIDLDRFRTLNELYGRPVGDAALVHVAGILAAQVPDGATAARMGGDEFAVLLPTMTREQTRQVAVDLLEAVRAVPMEHGATGLPVSVSIGLAHRVAGVPDLTGLYAAADAALHRAKSEGRGRVVVA